MTDIQAIQEEIIAGYALISFPSALGTPTGYKHEPDGGFNSADLPAVIVTRGIQLSSEPLSSDANLVTREYITDVYTYTTEDTDDVKATERDNTADCIPSVLSAFGIYDLNTTGVLSHRVTADTGDVELYARDNTQNYIGVRFRHEVVYRQSI